jgi:choline-glycine betaine transporter
VKLSLGGKSVVIPFQTFASHSSSRHGIKEDSLAGFFACDFLAYFVMVVHPTTIFCSSITRSANA